VFIVVVGVHDIRRTLDFYATTFGLPVTEPAPSRVDVLADAWGLPRSEPFLLGIARLPERFLIEVDGGITVDNASAAARAGADVIVAGTAIFGAGDYGGAITAMRRNIGAEAVAS